MSLTSEQKIGGTPLGVRLVFGLSVSIYLLYALDLHDFVSLHTQCKPYDIMYRFRLQGLLFASVTFKSWPALLVGMLVSWRRFATIEYDVGTLGFLLWFVCTSVLFHGSYCVLTFLLSCFYGSIDVMTGEVHGLWPVIIATLVVSAKDSDNLTVMLWPLPIQVPARVYPLILVVVAWISHAEASFDVAAAYIIAGILPAWLWEPSASALDALEQSTAGRALLHQLQALDCFVCRPPPITAATCGPVLAVAGAAECTQNQVLLASEAPAAGRVGNDLIL
eukprot:gnl/TRDRNA2_/TRDRNA2_127001_c0_seq1.p1 gnl/TRDRNA2_/TRDRNA2_127001_c0~~gnl/TRDRNA2_/TRDRNA2_127001_c0_seq1.p1  ORF type:complete len:278 (+),score=19.74 gnl/TRDRNA2_/TRDRNA2_127001_c0_seq1:115-948(+)